MNQYTFTTLHAAGEFTVDSTTPLEALRSKLRQLTNAPRSVTSLNQFASARGEITRRLAIKLGVPVSAVLAMTQEDLA